MIAALALLLPALVTSMTFNVQVGSDDGQLTYNPQFITNAVAGDTVSFTFHPKAHSVTEAAFASPCSPLQGGFDTDLKTVAPGTADASLTVVPLTLTNNSTRWFYCKQQGPPIHCQQGMVFAINPTQDPNGNTFEKFQNAAKALAGGSTTNTTTAPAATYTPPPPPVIDTVTVTVTAPGGNIYTTTYASWEGSPANPTPAAQPATHTVQVGNNGALAFDPPQATAAIGDVIQFVFHAKAHSATQSNFGTPCSPKDGGFDTGLMPVTADATSFPEYSVTVNDTLPIWVYCKQQGPPIHCQQGMVFAVNAPTTGPNTFDAFQLLAKNSANVTTNSTGTGTGTGTGSGSGNGTSSGNAPNSTGGANGGKNGVAQVAVSMVGLVLGFIAVSFSL